MTILSWPSGIPAPNDFSFGLAANTQSGGRSPLDGTEQTLALPGARWMAELRFRNLDLPQWRILDGFVARLGGRAGRFTWAPPRPRRGVATVPGAITMTAGTAAGSAALSVTGFGAGSGVAWEAGDLLGWVDGTGRAALHMAVAATSVNGSGAATVTLAPPIRRGVATGTALTMTSPPAVWRLQRDDVMADYEPGDRGHAVTLPIEEAIW